MAGPQLPVPTWFVGCGNMGGAIVEGWRTAGIDLSSAVVIRPSGMPVVGVKTVTSFAEANCIGWAHWEFAQGFGLLTNDQKLDEPIARKHQ